VIDDAVALVKDARHRLQAEAFIEWVGSKEAVELAAREAFRLPARTDVSLQDLPAWAQRVMSELVSLDVDWEMIERRGSEWIETWDRKIRGQGG
jgi:ABC-type Fe3+ transport system substrate-binding protein